MNHPRKLSRSGTLDAAVVGAGPYGLSIGAHLRARGVPFRIFGRPMDSWLAHMPKGMWLKSDGFASNLSDPDDAFTLRRYCAEKGIEYADTVSPVSLETFAAYGLAFGRRMVPELEDKIVAGMDHNADGFLLRLDDGEIVSARRVVLAVGITHFGYVPPNFADLPPEALSHSSCHHDLEPLRGRSVVVVGGGASAIDLAGLLRDADVDVQLIARHPLKFHGKPEGGRRSLWRQLRYPQSGIGPGLRTRLCADAPLMFHYLPQSFRLNTVHTVLGPAGGWFAREKVIGRVPLLIGYTPERAEVQGGKVRLRLHAADGSERDLVTEHVIAATGYKVDIARLSFLSAAIRSRLEVLEGAPLLASNFESSVPGLYFVGIAAANSFGPVMRFAFGARFAAHHVTKSVTRWLAQNRAVKSPRIVATAR